MSSKMKGSDMKKTSLIVLLGCLTLLSACTKEVPYEYEFKEQVNSKASVSESEDYIANTSLLKTSRHMAEGTAFQFGENRRVRLKWTEKALQVIEKSGIKDLLMISMIKSFFRSRSNTSIMNVLKTLTETARIKRPRLKKIGLKKEASRLRVTRHKLEFSNSYQFFLKRLSAVLVTKKFRHKSLAMRSLMMRSISKFNGTSAKCVLKPLITLSAKQIFQLFFITHWLKRNLF